MQKGPLSNALGHALPHIDDSHLYSNGAAGSGNNHNHVNCSPARPYKITLLTRLNQTPSNPHIITHVTATFDLSSLASAFRNQDVVISTIHAGDVPFQKLLIDAAIAAGVRRFVPNEFNHNTLNARVRERFPPCQARAEVLQYLRDQTKKCPGFSWTGLATGCLIDEGLRGGLLGFDLCWSSATVYGSGEERFACSTLKGVAKAVVEALDMGEEAKNQYLYAARFLTCQNEILKALETCSGKKWTVGRADVEEALREGQVRMEKGFLDGTMVLLERSMLFGEIDDVESWQRQKIDLEGRKSLEQVVGQTLMDLEKDRGMDCGCG